MFVALVCSVVYGDMSLYTEFWYRMQTDKL